MQIVVLAGGRGQRLYPLTAHRPKPLLPIMGRPLLGQLLRHLASQDDVDEIVVTTGHLGEMIERYVANLLLPVPVRAVQDEAPRGGAGAVAELLPRLRSPFAVVSADTAVDLDLAAMVATHRRLGVAATVCVTSERVRLGVVESTVDQATAFLDMPELGRLSPSAGLNARCYVLDHAAFAGWGTRVPFDFGRDLLPRLLAEGHAVATVPAARFWADIATADAYRDAHLRAVGGTWPWPVPQSGRPAQMSGQVEMAGPVHFGSNVVIGPNARLTGPLYVGSDVVIGPGAEVVRSVLLNGCVIGAGSLVHEAVVDSGAILPRSSAASGGVVGSVPAQARATRGPARAGHLTVVHAVAK